MLKNNIKQCLGLLKKGLLDYHAKRVSLISNNHQCMTQLALINIHPNEYTKGLP